MSDKIDSMATVAEGIRTLSSDELEHVFGGCGGYLGPYDSCETGCLPQYGPMYSFQNCYYQGALVCSTGITWDPYIGCPY